MIIDTPAAADSIDPASIESAAARILAHVRRTPVIDIRWQSKTLNLKLEFLQVSGTFKARGAFNRLLSVPPARRVAGIAAASGGNHGIAVAHAAHSLGVAAHIFVPAMTPPAKLDRLRSLNANVRAAGAAYSDALAACDTFTAASGALWSHAYDQAETLAGQGTVASEWFGQAPELDTVLVAVGGGGLIGGMAAWYRNRVKLVAVESTGCPTLHRALAAGRIVDVDVSGLAADSLGARRAGALMFPIAQRFVAASLLVDDAAIRRAQHWLWNELRVAVEPGGATAMAALLSAAYVPRKDEKVGVLLCGANADPTLLFTTGSTPVKP